MDLTLDAKWEEFVNQKVQAGPYRSANDVIYEGLRLLEEQDALKSISPQSVEELEDMLFQGLDDLENGRTVDPDEAFRALKQNILSK